ncbi:MAG: hypothetical protein ACQERC_08765 [Bacteroidota bacterium]
MRLKLPNNPTTGSHGLFYPGATHLLYSNFGLKILAKNLCSTPPSKFIAKINKLNAKCELLEPT